MPYALLLFAALFIFFSTDLFNTKILLRLDDNSIRKYIGISTNWQPESNRALLINETISDTPIPFVPYSSMSSKIIVEELFKGD